MRRTSMVRPEAWIFGVTAGVSARLGWSIAGCRLAMLVLAYLFPMKVIVGYLIAYWLLPDSWLGR